MKMETSSEVMVRMAGIDQRKALRAHAEQVRTKHSVWGWRGQTVGEGGGGGVGWDFRAPKKVWGRNRVC